MKLEKLPSGSYRAKKIIKGKTYRVTFDHKPSQKELIYAFADVCNEGSVSGNASFTVCVDKYIETKNNVLSPATVRGYRSLQRNCPEWFLNMNIYDMTQVEVQKVVNEYSSTHAPKSVKNFHALISPVMGLFRPNLTLKTTLPLNIHKETEVPIQNDIKRLLDALKGTEYYIPVYLGCLGLRRSEIIALSPADFNGNTLTINKASVPDENNGYTTKITKTDESSRKIYVPTELVKAVKEKGYVYNNYPNSILRAMHRYQDKIGMPRCRFHDLRHFYASYAHSEGMSDADIMKSGGWKTDTVMKRIYRHAMNAESEQKRIATKMFE